MTATTLSHVDRVPDDWRAAVNDVLLIMRRNLLGYVRQPQLVVFMVIQPVMFVLLFTYVFGGAIDIPGVSYANFLVPGIIAQSVAFNSAGTSVAVADDLSKGILDRFRSLPMAHGAVLTGRVATTGVVTLFTTVLMAVVGYVVGFRIQTGVLQGVLALLFLMAFGVTLAWIAAVIGLTVKDPEAAQSAGFIWLFPLNFVSSVFVPVDTMPGPLQAFADINPITLTVNTVRGLVLGPEFAERFGIDVGAAALGSFAWFAAITLLFGYLARRGWRRLG
ncbi:MAG TPA: ABC transporter permease [Nitriliruptorales bacterium]